MKKALLDTNVIIHREAKQVSRGDIGVLFWWLDKLRYGKCIHKVTAAEINRHGDRKVKNTMAIKLENYDQLQVQAPESEAIKNIARHDASANDRNDTLLLCEVYADRVDILITEDRKIHEKAEKLNVQDRVFTIKGFIDKARAEQPELPDYKVLSVQRPHFGELDVNDPFFDSFRKDYRGFNEWFNKKSEEKAFVCKNEQAGRIAAFLYLKIESADENDPKIHPPLPSGEKLKIGSFKVHDTGHKLGERFLKIAFDAARIRKVQKIYVTIFKTTEEHLSLIRLLTAWGFVLHGTKKDGPEAEKFEDVYVRDFSPRVHEDIKATYPFISNAQRKFIVSVRPEYHTELLPDSILKTENPEDFQASKGHRNAIQKVFVSHGKDRSMRPKDIIVFYRTGGIFKGVVTTIGVVESVVQKIPNVGKFLELCRSRSVFSKDELRSIWDKYPWSEPFIVNFLYVYSLPSRPNLAKLIKHGVIADVRSVPQAFEPLSDNQFNTILEISNAKKDFIVDQT